MGITFHDLIDLFVKPLSVLKTLAFEQYDEFIASDAEYGGVFECFVNEVASLFDQGVPCAKTVFDEGINTTVFEGIC